MLGPDFLCHRVRRVAVLIADCIPLLQSALLRHDASFFNAVCWKFSERPMSIPVCDASGSRHDFNLSSAWIPNQRLAQKLFVGKKTVSLNDEVADLIPLILEAATT